MKPEGRLGLFFIFFVFLISAGYSQEIEKILEKVDDYRKIGDAFSMKLRISDFNDGRLSEEANFLGFFSSNDKSLVVCKNGKNKGMKVLMKGDDMWVCLVSSKRALRITPRQRLMGQASIGDVSKISFSKDYSGEILGQDDQEIKVELKARGKGATYQKIILSVQSKDLKPRKAEFYLLSGKHLKTAYYEDYVNIENREVNCKIRIEDAVKNGSYSVMTYSEFKKTTIPDKYFNVMSLPYLELD